MAFLDNSGDIILDAVLTDTGRMRLAKGDGSFRISKYALGDDEINYALYNRDDSRGSAYFDLDILTTPVFEAFTNNISSLNSRLMTIASNTHMYLPILKLNNLQAKNNTLSNKSVVTNGFLLTADAKTAYTFFTDPVAQAGNIKTVDGTPVSGVGMINGSWSLYPNTWIRVDQGIDNTNVPATKPIDPELKETQYLVEVDNRLVRIIQSDNSTVTDAQYSYVDDDNIAAYFFSLDGSNSFVKNLDPDNSTSVNSNTDIIKGARGTSLEFSLTSKDDIILSDYLFQQIGNNVSQNYLYNGSPFTNLRTINTTVRITGLTTGYSLEVPVVIFKHIA